LENDFKPKFVLLPHENILSLIRERLKTAKIKNAGKHWKFFTFMIQIRTAQ